MASIQAIAKGKAYQYGLEKTFGVRPKLNILQDHVRLSWEGANLKTAQNNFSTMLDQPPGEVRIDIAPVLYPALIKKYGVYALGMFLGGIAVSKLIG